MGLARRLGRVPRHFSTASSSCWRVAVVGSGPSAFYLTDHLIKKNDNVKVSLFERLPIPFGLVRYGVAPDHQDVKNVTERFTQIASSPRVSFFGNVEIGDVPKQSFGSPALLSLETLQQHYDAVVLAYGASADRELSAPGEGLPGVSSARSFVEWYNGHPGAVGHQFHLDKCETAVIVGQGNVALDCARILCKQPSGFGGSDIAEHAAEQLSRSAVKQVVLVGRRGPLQAAFTIKELRDLSKLDGVSVTIPDSANLFTEGVLAAAAKDRARKRIVDLMRTLPDTPAAAPRQLSVQFLRSPMEFVEGDDGSLAALRLHRTELEGEPGPRQSAAIVPDSASDLPCQLALTSVGYRSLPLAGAPFDAKQHVVPNSGGRVEGATGLYVTGWLKRGPSGVILTNIADATESANALLSDFAGSAEGRGGGSSSRGGDEAVAELIAAQGKRTVDFPGWLAVDAEERRRAEGGGKVREKITSTQEMLDVALG